MAVALFLRREYIVALMRALEKRLLRGASLSLSDASSIEILKRALNSPHPGEVLYSLNMLEEMEHESLGELLIGLINHPAAAIRKDVLTRIARLRVMSALDSLTKRVEEEEEAEVKGAALKTLCELGETEVFDFVYPYLNDDDWAIRKGAMVGLLRSGGIEGVLAAGESLMALVQSRDSHERRCAAEVFGDMEIRHFYRPLVQLLNDSHHGVKRAALAAAGDLGNPRLWPLVIEHLGMPEVSETAFSALVKGGESVVGDLERHFLRKDQDSRARMRVVKIAGRIRGGICVEFLLKHIGHPDAKVRHQILLSLSACSFRADEVQKRLIRKQIFNDIGGAAWSIGALVDIGEEEKFAMLSRALLYDIDRSIDRMLLLLSFVYPSEAILGARTNLTHASVAKRAYAMETLDNLLSQELKDAFLPLIDDIKPDQKLKRLEHVCPQEHAGAIQRLSEIIERPLHASSAWSKACSLYILGQMMEGKYTDAVAGALASSSETVRETALWALWQIKPDDLQEHIGGLVHDSSTRVARMARYIMSSESVVRPAT